MLWLELQTMTDMQQGLVINEEVDKKNGYEFVKIKPTPS